MLNIVKALIICLTLISCKTGIICSELKKNDIEAVVRYEISFIFNECYASCFDLDDYKTLPDANCPDHQMGSLPIEECDGVSGFSLESWASELKPKIKRYNKIKKDVCN